MVTEVGFDTAENEPEFTEFTKSAMNNRESAVNRREAYVNKRKIQP